MFMRTKSSIRIMMTIIMKLVPLMPSLRLSTRVLRSTIILSSGRSDRQGTEEMKLDDLTGLMVGQDAASSRARSDRKPASVVGALSAL
jgi:hypothetical protein